MKRAIYTGTFDPFTNGHKDILERSLDVFDEVIVLIAISPNKKSLLDLDQRLDLLNKIFKDRKNIIVDSWQGLVVEYAKKNNVNHIVRGLRPTGDFESEYQMASMNKSLSPNIETVFLMTGNEHSFVSSSLVKEIFKHGGDISPFVPSEVLDCLNNTKKA